MSTPAQYYQSLPPVSKFYGVACLMTTSALYLGLYDPWNIALSYQDVFKRFQVWRLITNFFFLGPFSPFFAIRLIMIARYGVLLERGPFDKRTADYVWMLMFGALSLLVMAAIPFLWTPFMAGSLVFMIVYVWSREFPNAQISIYGVVTLKGFYLPWALLALDLIFGASLMEDIIGMVAGHLYYFLTVLHPLAGGKYVLKTPLWVHKLVAYWGRESKLILQCSVTLLPELLSEEEATDSMVIEQEQLRRRQSRTRPIIQQGSLIQARALHFGGKGYRLSGH